MSSTCKLFSPCKNLVAFLFKAEIGNDTFSKSFDCLDRHQKIPTSYIGLYEKSF
jgi:hypothetical protein